MAKKTAIIDLGSNSMRMAIFARTSRYGFYILNESKVKVRLGENAYENGGYIQPSSMQKVLNGFAYFKKIAKENECDKFYCIGTSALRDAPNANEFIKLVKNKYGLNLKRIDGKTEAKFGGIAANNLLYNIKNATTIDIGGGSTELALIQNSKVVDAVSLNLGTVRLKELFFDKKNLNGAKDFIDSLISQIPPSFKNDNLIAIGGSLRAISNAIMEKNNHPLKIVHNFSYNLEDEKDFISAICNSSATDLKNFSIKQERFDTIREGVMIFLKIAQYLESKYVCTSGAGVREGVFLNSILGKFTKFPPNFNPSLKSLQDRFLTTSSSKICKYCRDIFDALKPIHNIDERYLFELNVAAKLHNIGSYLGFYSEHLHSSYMVLNSLNYGYTHAQKSLISLIIKNHGKKEVDKNDLSLFGSLLPDAKTILWLSFILSFAKILTTVEEKGAIFTLSNQTLHIENFINVDIQKEQIKKLSKPATFAISFD